MDQPSCNQLLVTCMEKFGESEPRSIIAIWVDEEGITHWEYNAPRYQVLGLLGVATNFIAAQCMGLRGFSK